MRNQAKVRLYNVAVGAAIVVTVGQHAQVTGEYPPIGDPGYNASCQILQTWEDGSAQAYCRADGETWVYDADGQPYPNAAGVPVRGPGWYVAPEILQLGPGAIER